MKRFISVMPLQQKGRLNSIVYKSLENDALKYDEEVQFPIIPAIANCTGSDEHIEIIAIITENDNAKYNFELFKNAVENLSKNPHKPFTYKIKEVSTPYDERIKAQLQLFSDLIACVDDNDEIYACITYGTKPTPIILSMALNYAYKIKKDVRIGAVIYGMLNHDKTEGYLYDTTALFYMDAIVNKLAIMNIKDPRDKIEKMLSLGEDDNTNDN